jgi:hypothetical protein
MATSRMQEGQRALSLRRGVVQGSLQSGVRSLGVHRGGGVEGVRGGEGLVDRCPRAPPSSSMPTAYDKMKIFFKIL